jgi:hypothetical protein
MSILVIQIMYSWISIVFVNLDFNQIYEWVAYPSGAPEFTNGF